MVHLLEAPDLCLVLLDLLVQLGHDVPVLDGQLLQVTLYIIVILSDGSCYNLPTGVM